MYSKKGKGASHSCPAKATQGSPLLGTSIYSSVGQDLVQTRGGFYQAAETGFGLRKGDCFSYRWKLGLGRLWPLQRWTKSRGCGSKWRALGDTQTEQQRPALNPAAFQRRLACNVHPAVFLVKWLPCFKKQRGLICWSVPLRVQLSACSCCSNCETEISPETGKNVGLS